MKCYKNVCLIQQLLYLNMKKEFREILIPKFHVVNIYLYMIGGGGAGNNGGYGYLKMCFGN